MKTFYVAVVLAMAVLTGFAKQAHATHFKIWLKAFIPNVGLDIVQAVPGTSGHTMIPGPHIMGIPVDSTCYNTNDRDFSASADADAKITIITEFDILAPGIANIVKTDPQIGQSVRYNCDDGTVIGTASASSQNITLGQPSYTGGVVTFSVDAEASNPFVPLPQSISPSIKIHGTVTVDTTQSIVTFSGTVAKFPSYEAYVSIDNASPVTLFNISPASDSSPWSLVFNVAVNKSASY